tara:strand:- start:33948 stop:34748 length:801 start_codon:yes stop_codon:yes gene_type:complete
MKKYLKFTGKNKLRLFGFIPARMAATRFPGKPLKKILGKPMIEHVFQRASLFKKWEQLYLTTCDKEIRNFSKSKNIPCIMTSKTHQRCLDRIYEAASKIKKTIRGQDLIICVQGDEPMMRPEMIKNVIKPFFKKKGVMGTVLAMDIISKDQFYDKNIVKIIHDENDEVLYTSRSPVPYVEKFNMSIKAKRIYGIFAFRWQFLKKFHNLPMSNLEILESCDSNRICDNGRGQFIARQKYFPSFSVDCLADLKKVEKFIKKDPYLGKY